MVTLLLFTPAVIVTHIGFSVICNNNELLLNAVTELAVYLQCVCDGGQCTVALAVVFRDYLDAWH